MTNQTTILDPKLEQTVSQLRCIACARVHKSASRTLRCPSCGDLLEIIYPAWKTSGARAAGLNASELKALWRERRSSRVAVDQSGVWRFRELLPALAERPRSHHLA